jgi:WxL domain surface cell wall-binding
MFNFSKMIKGFGLALAVSALMVPVAAFASDGTTATVTGGSLSITNPAAANFTGANITGVAQTTDAALDTFSVSDLTGTGAGWHVTAQASQFTGASVHATVTATLAVGSLLMSAPTVASPNTTSPDPTVVTTDSTIDNGAFQIATAAADEGMGTYDFSATTLTLALPAFVYADTYASTVTISVITAP